MLLARALVDWSYPFFRMMIFRYSREDPEKAHEFAISQSKLLHKTGLDRILLDNPANHADCHIRFANASGSNKSGDIPESILKYLGFDINNIGTVTNNAFDGKPRPRIKRYLPDSMINWMGLPNPGSKAVAEILKKQKRCGIPRRVSVMQTPGKTGNSAVDDVVASCADLNDYADEFEVNYSCPNTGHEAENNLNEILSGIESVSGSYKSVYIKLSPDSNEGQFRLVFDACRNYKFVKGFTVFNTTKSKDCLPADAPEGGGSGDFVYDLALRKQKLVVEIMKKGRYPQWSLNVCGGINSVERMNERITAGIGQVMEVQGYTPFIYKGPRLLREMKKAVVI